MARLKRSRRDKAARLLIDHLPDVVWYRLPFAVRRAITRASF